MLALAERQQHGHSQGVVIFANGEKIRKFKQVLKVTNGIQFVPEEACVCLLRPLHVLSHLHTLRLPTAVGQSHTSYSEQVLPQQLEGVKRNLE